MNLSPNYRDHSLCCSTERIRDAAFEHTALLQVYAVFGFCDIRQFTDATEVLQEEVMEFVNSIAKIVHMEVSLHGGFPNKNIGDAFLLVRPLVLCP